MAEAAAERGADDPLRRFRLDGKVAIVTGASSGLGQRFARVLDGLGAKVVLVARRAERLEALAAGLDGAHVIAADVTVDGANDRIVEEVMGLHRRLDVVVANAGVTNVAPALRETPAMFDEVVQLNLVAQYALARAAAKEMKDNDSGGSIVMIGSAAAFGSDALLPQAGYVASKTAVIGLTRELALQWSRYHIRVNALCPGMFSSEMTTDLVDNDELRQMFETTVPLGRIGGVDELDGALTFLAGDASSYMTGQTLIIDGGVTIR